MSEPTSMKVVRFEGEGPVKTRIVSDDPSPHGWGVFDVKVTTGGIEFKAVGESEWHVYAFSDLTLLKVRELLLDCDFMLIALSPQPALPRQ